VQLRAVRVSRLTVWYARRCTLQFRWCGLLHDQRQPPAACSRVSGLVRSVIGRPRSGMQSVRTDGGCNLSTDHNQAGTSILLDLDWFLTILINCAVQQQGAWLQQYRPVAAVGY
jgi:hypothetical protein